MSLELCALVALAKSFFSTSATFNPRSAASRATQAPVTPPPMISRSKTSLDRRSRSRCIMDLCGGGIKNKTPPRQNRAGFQIRVCEGRLFDLAFFEFHMLAQHGIVLLDRELLGHG